MSTPLGSRLDVLADAFAGHGVDVRANLLPGATPDDIDAVGSALGVRLPAAYRDLYGWSAGPADDSPAAPILHFRDEELLPLGRVVEERRLLTETYDWYDEVDLTTVAPFAGFQSSTLVVACGPQRLTDRAEHPVVSFFQGIDLFYDSIAAMVETAIAWVSQPDWEPYAAAPNELAIWRRHNAVVDF